MLHSLLTSHHVNNAKDWKGDMPWATEFTMISRVRHQGAM
ncbi:hypothetical protein [Roseobacter sp. S98]